MFPRLLALLMFSTAALQTEESNLVYRIQIAGVINPASSEFIETAIDEANENGASCLVIELDTPGGLMKSMNAIIKAILSSEVPVVVYVSPSGSHCASAGVFIMMAAHVAAMSPATNIGAAHPVNVGGGADTSTVMMEKITNDAVSYIRSLAEKNGRNADWAEDAVVKSVSITERQALDEGVVDLIAQNFDSLLAAIDQRTVPTIIGTRTIHSNPAVIRIIERDWRFGLLDVLTDPNVAYMLMMLGMYGLFFEIYNPGMVVPGVFGGICIILALYSFHMLPVNYAGVALIALSLILFLLEIKIASHGVLSIGGVISLFLGSIMLIDSTQEMMEISLGVIIPVVGITAFFFLSIITIGIRAQRSKIASGLESMIGEIGTVTESIRKRRPGQILVHGEIWQAKSAHPVTKGKAVRVTKTEGMTLTVEPADGAAKPASESPTSSTEGGAA